MDALSKLSRALDIALFEEEEQTPWERIEAVSKGIEKSVDDIMLKLGISIISEAAEVERKVKVSIKKAGSNHNIYKIEIPTKVAGKSGKAFVTYASLKSTKQEDESDEDATARIISQLKKDVLQAIANHGKAREEGRTEDARKIIDDLAVSYEEAEQQFNNAEKGAIAGPAARQFTADQAGALQSFAKHARKARSNFLHKKGLLAREDVAKSLGIKDKDSLMQFALNALQQIGQQWPTWERLATAKDLGPKDIQAQLPDSNINSSLAAFVTQNSSKPIDVKKLSNDAAEAIAAASLIVAATIKAAAAKVEAMEG